MARGTHRRTPEPEPEEPDVRYTINLGLLGPVYEKATDRPLRKGRWYMDTDDHNPPRSWELPTTPLYHTKGKCGVKDIPIVNVPETGNALVCTPTHKRPALHADARRLS